MTLADPSSAELVAGRTNVNTGKSYDTIGRRLDAEHADVTAQLADISINVKQFEHLKEPIGATGDYDWAPAIQAAIDFLYSQNSSSNQGGTVLIPAGTFYVIGKAQTIKLRSNVSIRGIGKSSVIKIHESTGDWGTLFSARDEVMHDIEISNLMLDCNESNIVTKTEQWGTSNRVFLNLGEGYNFNVNNIHFITNGVWCIRAKARNSTFHDLKFDFTSANLPGEFDVSTLWCGGSTNNIYNNTFNVMDSSVFRPATAMEIQGHYTYIYNNRVFDYTSALIFTNSTSYENKYDVISTLGAIKSSIYNNIFSVCHTGIDLWGMYKEGGNGSFYKVTIHDNDIRINNEDDFGLSSRCGIKTHKANQFSDNPVDRQQNCNFDGLEIFDNRIEFAERKPLRTIYNSDTGIKIDNIVAMINTVIKGNTIKNAGGHGIYWASSLLLKKDESGNWIDDPSSNDNFHEFNLIESNVFEECLIPIKFGRHVRDTTIINNIFRQKSYYENYSDNMVETVINYATTNPENVRFRIKDNKIETVSSLKPFYPQFKSKSANILDYDDNTVLDDLAKMQFEYPNVKYQIVPYGYYLKLLNGNVTSPRSLIWTTRGDLKTFIGGDVIIKDIIDSNVLLVNDSTNIYPLQTLSLDSNFNSTYAIVSAVVGNYVICINNVALKSGVDKSYLNTFILKYFNNLATITTAL